jgi:hypothetical protein
MLPEESVTALVEVGGSGMTTPEALAKVLKYFTVD